MADAMSDLGKAVGLTAGEVAKFSLAVSQSGGNMENAGKMITTFYQHLEKAAEGGEDAQDALEKVGITLNDLRTLSERQLLQKAIDSLAEMGEGAKRTAAGVELFGKSFRLIDPKQMQEILKSGDFDKLSDALDKVGQMNDDLARKFFYLQAAAAQAFATIGDYLEPIFGKTQDANDEFERAQNLIKAIGLALAAYVGVKTVTTILDLVNAFKLFNKESKIQVGISAALQALQGPKGWAILAGSVAAAGAAIYGLNKLMDEYTDKVDAARQAREALEGGKTDKPFDPGAQQFDKNKLKQREAAVTAQKEQNALLREQNAEANKYQEIINGTIGTLDEQAARVKLIADIDRDTANQKSQVQKQINIELAKGKDVNMELVKQLQEQLKIIDAQSNARKVLGQAELTALEVERQRKDLIAQNAERTKMQIGDAQALSEAELARMLVAGQITEQQKKDYTDYIKIASDGAKNLADLQKQLDQSTSTIEKNNIMELMNLEAERTRRAIEGKKEEIRQRNELEQSYQAGVVKALEKIADQYKPINMAQEAISKGWGRISDAVDTFVDTGKFKFSDFARSVIADLAKMIAKAAIFQAISAALGFFGLKIPGLAEGGPVKQNQPYVVGEKGPELFVPKSAGDIIPNKDMGAPSMAKTNDGKMTNAPITNNYNTYNINALDAKSVAQMFAENRKAIFGANKMAEREMSYAGVR
jgi:lambda family phage tail tape measure protein